MYLFLLPFALSACSMLVLLNWLGHAERWKLDAIGTSPQHAHTTPIPRIGGVGVALASAVGLTLIGSDGCPGGPVWVVGAAALAAFLIGLGEDLTGRVSVRVRLIGVAVAAMAATLAMPTLLLRHTGLPPLDWLVALPLGALALTVFTITGVTNAFNIIDGLNGLSSMCAMIILAGMAYVGFAVGDAWLAKVALVVAGSLAGFFVWNYPAGHIFMGDGGAYFSGFAIAVLGLLLIARNADVAPIFPLLLCSYPVSETVFSMYRRARRQRAMSRPDRGHLHSLLYRRLQPRLLGSVLGGGEERHRRNSITSPYLWVLCTASVGPSVWFYDNQTMLGAVLLLFVMTYVTLYRRIVRFRTPRCL